MVDLLQCTNVSKSFSGLQALKNVDLMINENEITGLVGPNGSGKSTFLNVIVGILRPDSGQILFMKDDISKLPTFKICRRGVVKTTQITQSFPTMTTIDNVLAAILFSGATHRNGRLSAVERSRELLEFVGIQKSKFDIPVQMLNLAELRRVQLARALATEPKLLLLDEILTGLNPKECNQAIELIKNINNQGVTILIVEHVMRIIMSLCHHVTVLHHGEKISEGPPQDVVKDEAVIKVYLGKSYSLHEDQ